MAFKPGIRSKFGFAPESTTKLFPQDVKFNMSCEYIINPEFPGEVTIKDDDFDEDPEEALQIV